VLLHFLSFITHWDIERESKHIDVTFPFPNVHVTENIQRSAIYSICSPVLIVETSVKAQCM